MNERRLPEETMARSDFVLGSGSGFILVMTCILAVWDAWEQSMLTSLWHPGPSAISVTVCFCKSVTNVPDFTICAVEIWQLGDNALPATSVTTLISPAPVSAGLQNLYASSTSPVRGLWIFLVMWTVILWHHNCSPIKQHTSQGQTSIIFTPHSFFSHVSCGCSYSLLLLIH